MIAAQSLLENLWQIATEPEALSRAAMGRDH